MATSMQVRAISCPLPRTGGSINLAIGVPGDSKLARYIDELLAKLVPSLQGKVASIVDAYIIGEHVGACQPYVTPTLREITEEEGAPTLILDISTTLSVTINIDRVNDLTHINIFDDLLQIAKKLMRKDPEDENAAHDEKMFLRGLCLAR